MIMYDVTAFGNMSVPHIYEHERYQSYMFAHDHLTSCRKGSVQRGAFGATLARTDIRYHDITPAVIVASPFLLFYHYLLVMRILPSRRSVSSRTKRSQRLVAASDDVPVFFFSECTKLADCGCAKYDKDDDDDDSYY